MKQIRFLAPPERARLQARTSLGSGGSTWRGAPTQVAVYMCTSRPGPGLGEDATADVSETAFPHSAQRGWESADIRGIWGYDPYESGLQTDGPPEAGNTELCSARAIHQ